MLKRRELIELAAATSRKERLNVVIADINTRRIRSTCCDQPACRDHEPAGSGVGIKRAQKETSSITISAIGCRRRPAKLMLRRPQGQPRSQAASKLQGDDVHQRAGRSSTTSSASSLETGGTQDLRCRVKVLRFPQMGAAWPTRRSSALLIPPINLRVIDQIWRLNSPSPDQWCSRTR